MASLMPANRKMSCTRLAFAIVVTTSMTSAPVAPAAEQADDCATASTCSSAANAGTSAKKLSRKERKRLRKEQEAQQEQERNEFLEWYPLYMLSPAQLAATPQHCSGAYIGPEFVASGRAYRPPQRFMIEPSPQTEAELSRQAEKMTQSVKGTEILADTLDYDKGDEVAHVSGNVAIRDRGALIRGSAATYNTLDGTGTIENADMVSHTSHARFHADKIARESETFIRITNGEFTQCAPSDNAWVIRAGEFRLNQKNNLATARNAQLRVKDVPVFWTPWITYPLNNERRSGLLFPTLSTSSSTNGLDFSIPWYWNIAPNMDATLIGRHAGDRGLALEAEFRYLNRFSEWQISGSIINDDTIEDGVPDSSGSIIENPRWLFSAQEKGSLPNSWNHRIDYTSVSDNEYLNDLSGATSLSVKRSTNLEQSAKIWRYGEQLDFRADLVGYQIIDDSVTEQYTRMPQLWLDFESSYRNNRPSWLMEAQLTNFQIGDASRPAGGRVYLEPGFSLPLTKPWGYFTPTVKIKSVTYALDDGCLRPSGEIDGIIQDPCPLPRDQVTDKNPSTTLPMFSLDTALYFDRPTTWFGKKFTHTLEPRLYYLYTEYEDQSDQPLFDTGFNTFDYQQLFRETRFTGYDRIADNNQITLGLTTRLKQASSGVDTIWASVGQAFFFADRQVTLDTPAESAITNVGTNRYSPIASELGYQWTRNLRSYATLIYDFNIVETVFEDPTTPIKDLANCATPQIPASCPNLKEERNGFRQGGLQFRYFGDNGLIFNAGYRYRVNETAITSGSDVVVVQDYINQTDFSTNFPVTRHWSVVARHNYDFTNNRTLGSVAGFEYNSCCWVTRVVYQSGLSTSGDAINRISPETERGIFFQIRLKGLGGADTGVESILKDSIFHYEDYYKRAEF